LKDPRLSKLISITEVNVTKDLRYAKVYVSVMGSEEEKANSLEVLRAQPVLSDVKSVAGYS